MWASFARFIVEGVWLQRVGESIARTWWGYQPQVATVGTQLAPLGLPALTLVLVLRLLMVSFLIESFFVVFIIDSFVESDRPKITTATLTPRLKSARIEVRCFVVDCQR